MASPSEPLQRTKQKTLNDRQRRERELSLVGKCINDRIGCLIRERRRARPNPDIDAISPKILLNVWRSCEPHDLKRAENDVGADLCRVGACTGLGNAVARIEP